MNGLIVRSERFEVHQKVGNVVNQASRYNQWDVDELIYLDISRDKFYDLGRDDHKIHSYSKIEEIIDRISSVCFMPLAFGGGIRTMEDVDVRIKSGADKVVINTQALDQPNFIAEIAEKYGSQAVIVSVDYRIKEGTPMVYKNCGNVKAKYDVYTWVKTCEELGAGEIFLNSIDRDGMANGYDIDVIKKTVNMLDIPVIACGGAADEDDFIELAESVDVSGIAAGNMFHFTEMAYPRSKKSLKREKINVR